MGSRPSRLLVCALFAIPACDIQEGVVGTDTTALTKQERDGRRLFREETFGGIGRTCESCHGDDTGTVSPEDVQALFDDDPGGPLFRGDGADSPGSGTFDRILEHATIRVVLPLPANVSIVGSSDREVAVLRGIPTTMNTPALDTVLMYDGRAANLQDQARGAIGAHAESTDVSSAELDAIAAFQRTLFSRDNLKQFAKHGHLPVLPPGGTASEVRGRFFFTNDNPANGNPPQAACVHCHSGPMLDTTSPGLEQLTGGAVPAGSRFFGILVSEFNAIGNPVYTFQFTNPDGTTTDVVSPDPGRALISGNAADANAFKIPTVWGSVDTAPFFHDNSAKTVEEMLEHYDQFFNAVGFDITEQDKVDIANYMKLL